MITCLELSTRALGNALFEYATLFGVGNKLGFEIKLPVDENHVDRRRKVQHIIQLKNIFNIKTLDIAPDEVAKIEHTYVEKGHPPTFNSTIFNEVKDNTNLVGFFQSEQYFDFCENELRQQLTFKNEWIAEASKRFIDLEVLPQDCVALHIRRGDYLELQQHHPVLSPHYYNSALSYIEQYIINYKFNNPKKILVFSDDLEFCKNTFCDNSIFINIDNTDKGEYRVILDLVMYSMCQYYIIANSTYSWWAAWLGNPNKNKLTIAPSVWFGHANNFGGNHIPSKNWIKI